MIAVMEPKAIKFGKKVGNSIVSTSKIIMLIWIMELLMRQSKTKKERMLSLLKMKILAGYII